MTRVLLIHWNRDEAARLAAPLLAAGLEVLIEAEDGSRAVKTITTERPDHVLISLDRLPSHGRTIVQHLMSRKQTRELPILFFGGTPAAVQKTLDSLPAARHFTGSDLQNVLAALLERAAVERDTV